MKLTAWIGPPPNSHDESTPQEITAEGDDYDTAKEAELERLCPAEWQLYSIRRTD